MCMLVAVGRLTYSMCFFQGSLIIAHYFGVVLVLAEIVVGHKSNSVQAGSANLEERAI